MGVRAKWEAKLAQIGDKALKNTVRRNWHMGVTSFGGPPVHFKIVGAEAHEWEYLETNLEQFHDKFTKRLGWIDEQLVSDFRPGCYRLTADGWDSIKSCSASARRSPGRRARRCTMLSISSTTGSYRRCSGFSSGGESASSTTSVVIS
jgi:hypothetical protein